MTLNKLKILAALTFFLLSSARINFAQNKWVLIYEGKTRNIFIDINGLDKFSGDDFYVWAQVVNSSPVNIEGIANNVSKVRTYYHFNKKLFRYSMLIIIYYDKHDNVLKSFNYRIKSKIKDYQYNFPIIVGSDEQKIFNASMGIIYNK